MIFGRIFGLSPLCFGVIFKVRVQNGNTFGSMPKFLAFEGGGGRGCLICLNVLFVFFFVFFFFFFLGGGGGGGGGKRSMPGPIVCQTQ